MCAPTGDQSPLENISSSCSHCLRNRLPASRKVTVRMAIKLAFFFSFCQDHYCLSVPSRAAICSHCWGLLTGLDPKWGSVSASFSMLSLKEGFTASQRASNKPSSMGVTKTIARISAFFFLVPRAVCWWPPSLPASLPYFRPFSRLGVPLPACRSKGTINSWTINDLVTLQVLDGQSIPGEWLSVFPLLHTGNKWPQASPSQLLMYQNLLKILEGLCGLRTSLQPVMVLPSGKWWGSLK